MNQRIHRYVIGFKALLMMTCVCLFYFYGLSINEQKRKRLVKIKIWGSLKRRWDDKTKGTLIHEHERLTLLDTII